jgi:hypothetical protein
MPAHQNGWRPFSRMLNTGEDLHRRLIVEQFVWLIHASDPVSKSEAMASAARDLTMRYWEV